LNFTGLISILNVRSCGRGGTGRRAGLRSLLPQGSGSSILLVRTTSKLKVKKDKGKRSGVLFCFAFPVVTGKTLLMRDEFIGSLRSNQTLFGLDLSDATVERLARYYELVLADNPILHLVGPCSPAEFATRHILESLTLLAFLPVDARFADIGAGAGLPSIPCLIARPDVRAVLIESKEKKTTFLRTVLAELGLADRAKVINKQFSEVTRPHVSHVTCRALDKFAQKLPQLIKWSGDRQLLFFGGPALRDEMQRLGLSVREKLMPLSDQRFLFVVDAENQ
jgi:16S rRNA (guanine527-N7)-methyltransferase